MTAETCLDCTALRQEAQLLVVKWRSMMEIKDLGDLGAAFDQQGYGPDGFRPLRPTELKLLRMCADALAVLLPREPPL